MKFRIGDRVIVRAEAEEMQNALFQEIDGSTATVSEVYQNAYEPGVFRIEIELDTPIELHGERVKVVPGLYVDNLEKIDRVSENRKTGWLSGLAVSRFNRWNRMQSHRVLN